MYITQVTVGNLPPVGGVEFNCDKQVNLFVGPNASGKSTILLAMNGRYTESEPDITGKDIEIINLNEEGDDEICTAFLNVSDDWPRDVPYSKWRPVLYVPATRVSLRNRIAPLVKPGSTEADYLRHALHDVFDTDSGVFYGQHVEYMIDYLRDSPTLNRSQREQLRRALDIGYSCAKRICSEVLHDDISHTFVDLDESGRTVHYGMGVGTSDDIWGEPLYAGVLSSGTQGTLLWIYALALKMAHHYDWEEGWEKKPAILLIDEIENHLHPTWQRRVIPALLEHFPGLQIFATTHSPFMVAGLKAGQVHLLKRDADTGAVTATTNTEDVIGWTADEILRTMLGVDDPTDERTAYAAQKLRRLRKEGPRDTPEKEEERQKKMEELRKLVDRDLLAGGPMARQLEIFEEQFADALAQYRQSQSLNQENG